MIGKLFCKHEYVFVRNIYGDEIIHSGFKRSIWSCNKCRRVKLSDSLDKLITK